MLPGDGSQRVPTQTQSAQQPAWSGFVATQSLRLVVGLCHGRRVVYALASEMEEGYGLGKRHGDWQMGMQHANVAGRDGGVMRLCEQWSQTDIEEQDLEERMRGLPGQCSPHSSTVGKHINRSRSVGSNSAVNFSSCLWNIPSRKKQGFSLKVGLGGSPRDLRRW